MKIYILGDSHCANIYKPQIENTNKGINTPDYVQSYIKLLRDNNISDPLHIEDYLRLWGHEVINLSIPGCSVYDIFEQFSNIKEPYDRLIVGWTSLNRFNWVNDDLTVANRCGGDMLNEKDSLSIFLLQQSINRLESAKSGQLKYKLYPFMSYLVNLHQEKKPIVYCPFDNGEDYLVNEKWFMWEVTNQFFNKFIKESNILRIREETNEKLNGVHLGRYGNYYAALIFNTILEHTKDNEYDGFYLKDKVLISKINYNLENANHNLIETTL